jgi:hypothetical protein
MSAKPSDQPGDDSADGREEVESAAPETLAAEEPADERTEKGDKQPGAEAPIWTVHWSTGDIAVCERHLSAYREAATQAGQPLKSSPASGGQCVLCANADPSAAAGA